MKRDTIIIVAIASAFGALVLVVSLFRFIHQRSAKSNPLPPVQPLAHHREHQLAKLENSTLPRSQTWYDQNHLSAPQPFGSISPRGSRASLLPKNTSPTESESAASSPGLDQSLPIPTHSFNTARPNSSSSLGSSDPGHSPQVIFGDPLTLPRVRSVSSSPSPARRSRPLSTSSSHSTLYSKTSRNTLRGTPHSPHSQILIVLPAPLSQELSSSASGDQRRLSRIDSVPYDDHRTSVVDRWVSGTIHSEHAVPPADPPSSPNLLTKQRGSRRAVSASASPSFASSHDNSMELPTPPVPRVPSMYIDNNILGGVESKG
ncbi:hypothetical protein BDZ97DRAFT_1912243 [Flammula alnicola]|nr:hypothetical protein BDZ97DRAFT_1912243 [Flammula alnicola]